MTHVLVKWPCLFLAVVSCDWWQECCLRAFDFWVSFRNLGALGSYNIGRMHVDTSLCSSNLSPCPACVRSSQSGYTTFFPIVRMVQITRCRLEITMKSAVEPDARQSRIILVTLLTKRCHGDSGYSCCKDISQVAPSCGGPPARLRGHPLSRGL